MEFLTPWESVQAAQAAALLGELRKEISPGHGLHKVGLRALARSIQGDDVLFALDDDRVADVHLTWKRSAESLPCPEYRIYDSLNHWIAEVMLPAHEDFQS